MRGIIHHGIAASALIALLVGCASNGTSARTTTSSDASTVASDSTDASATTADTPTTLSADGSYRRELAAGDGQLFSCHRFFMENPSLSGRGTAGAKDVPRLAVPREDGPARAAE